MARIDWALLCDLAFFDRQQRLCVVGIVRNLPTPRLPLAIGHLMIVGRLVEIRRADEVAVSVGIVTPGGVLTTSDSSDHINMEMAQEYVLVTLRNIPIREEGVYRFRMALSGQAPVFVDVPVLNAGAPAAAELH